jgi:hypothetical protein
MVKQQWFALYSTEFDVEFLVSLTKLATSHVELLLILTR